LHSTPTPQISDSELEETPIINWFDSESDFPEMSSVSLSLNLCVNVGQFTITPQNNMALGIKDGSMTGSALNKGNKAGLALFEKI